MEKYEHACLECGACCTKCSDWDVEVCPDDKTPRSYTRSVRYRIGWSAADAEMGTRIMAHKNGRCVAFRGQALIRCHCSCYPRRPSPCKKFVPGSQECIEAICAA